MVKKSPKIFIVLPAFNESKVIEGVLRDIKKSGYNHIILVDDCSRDETAQLARKHGAIVYSHPVNRGAGAATMTGIQAALDLGADIIVLFDSDGQHVAKDIKPVITPILKNKAEVVIGSRLLNRKKGMPLIRRFLNWGGNIATWIFFGLMVSDSQSGFKAFTREAAAQIEIKSDGYEFCSEIIREIHTKKLKYVEVPIHVIYSDYSMAKGQSLAKSIPMLFRMMLRSLLR